MSDQAQTTNAAPVAPATPAPVDTNKVANAAAEAATTAATQMIEQKAGEIAKKMTAEKMQAAARALTGEDAPNPNKQVLEHLAKDTIKTLRSTADVAVNEVLSIINQREQIKNEQKEVAQKYVNDYPEIVQTKNVKLVEARAAQLENEGMSHKEALDASFKEVVAATGLKPISERQQSDPSIMGLPRGGAGYGATPKFDPVKSQHDFIAGMKSKINSQRVKKS